MNRSTASKPLSHVRRLDVLLEPAFMRGGVLQLPATALNIFAATATPLPRNKDYAATATATAAAVDAATAAAAVAAAAAAAAAALALRARLITDEAAAVPFCTLQESPR